LNKIYKEKNRMRDFILPRQESVRGWRGGDMTERDLMQIMVNGRPVGVAGLQAAIREIAPDCEETQDCDIAAEMLKRLVASRNVIRPIGLAARALACINGN
jgi:hypothetical protein